MLKFLILLLLALPAFAAEDPPEYFKWTTDTAVERGYIVLEFDGEYLSRFAQRKEAYEYAINHALHNRITDGAVRYRLKFPDELGSANLSEFIAGLPTDPPEEPAPPPDYEPPVDTGEMLDPNTAFACDGGENGTTPEPTGSDSNSGLWVDGQPDPVKSLRRLEQIAEAQPDGVDYRLCEGAVFEDQTLTIRKSGDVGKNNRVLMRYYSQQYIGNYSPTAKNHYAIPGWKPEEVNRVIVGCYKILNGVPRPCMDTLQICKPGVKTKCLDPQDYSLHSYFQG